MSLLERDDLLQELEKALTEVSSGSGLVVLVSGEAGIGKTTLIEQFIATQQAPKRLLWGACDPLFTPRPLGPLYDVAQQVRGDLLALLQQEAPRASIYSAVLDELTKSSPTLLVIEDVHWADEATLDLLKFLGRRISRVNSLLIITYRDDEVGLEHPLRVVLGDLPRRSISRIRVPPLSQAAVDQLVAQSGKCVEDLYGVTGGNPFFVTEVLASSDLGVPASVSDAVLSRAARLSLAARNVLEFVSVVPARVETWLLKSAIDDPTSALEECVRAGMLLSDGEYITFRHELARQCVEDSLTPARREKQHSLVLQSLLDRSSDAQLARIVHHAVNAREISTVLTYAPLAAKQAAALNAHRESASHYEVALKYGDTLDAVERAELLEAWSYECHLADQNEQAFRARREAVAIRHQLGDHVREGENLRWLSRFSYGLARPSEAAAYAAQAVSLLESLPPGPELAMAYSNRAQLHMLAQEDQEATIWGSRAIELAQELAATETLVHALNNVGTAEIFAHKENGWSKVEESLRLALANNLHEHVARAYINLGSCAIRDRNYHLAGKYLSDALDYTNEHDIELYRLYALAWRARSYFEQGEWGKAADDVEFVLAHQQLTAITKIAALAVLGHIRVRRGDPDAAPLIHDAHELATETHQLRRIAPVAAARVELAWLTGDLNEVKHEACRVLELAQAKSDHWIHGEFSFWLWRAGGSVPPTEDIAEPYLLQMSGDWQAAAEKWKYFGCPYEQAMALADGDETSQLQALEIFERLGAAPAAERIRNTLRAHGVRGIPQGPRTSTKENPAGLTNRQMEVLAMLSEGWTNSEIADRLFISTKTVDHHVSAILSKLDAHTRAEAVALAFQSKLIKTK